MTEESPKAKNVIPIEEGIFCAARPISSSRLSSSAGFIASALPLASGEAVSALSSSSGSCSSISSAADSSTLELSSLSALIVLLRGNSIPIE